MYNPVTKAMRYLRREYPFLTTMAAGGFGIGALTATIVSLATGTMFFMIPVAAVAFGAFFPLFSLVGGGELDRPDGNTVTLNGVKLVGRERDVASISMTQDLITSYTNKLQHMAELPERAMDKIMAHVFDIQDSLTRVRAYQESGGEPVTSFSFTRKIIDANGAKVDQAVVNRGLPLACREAHAAQLPAIFAAPGPLASVPSPRADFTGATNTNLPAPAFNPEVPATQATASGFKL
jgi:hypothetical protein